MKFCAAVLALAGWTGASDAQEPLRVDVTQGNLDPMPIAVPDFVGASDEALRRGADITRVVANDLASSGLFAPVDQDAFIEDIANIDLRPIENPDTDLYFYRIIIWICIQSKIRIWICTFIKS